MTSKNICIFCGSDLKGRSDKRYCDDVCRNNHHYALKKDNNSLVKDINNILVHNREVLKSFYKNKITVANRNQLVESGFDFELFTSIYRTRKNEEYRVVYDYAYKFISDDELLLIKY